MKWNTLDDVIGTLNKAMCGKQCVQVWLGIGNVMFIGFGDEVLPATSPGELHASPPYELQIDSADWWVLTGNMLLTRSTDGKAHAEVKLRALLGRRVVGWGFDGDSVALRICFEGGIELGMAPYSESDAMQEDAWILRGPTYYGYVRWDRTIGKGRRDHYFVDD